MFDFLFKKRTKVPAKAEAIVSDKKAELEAAKFSAKQADLDAANSFSGQEAAAVTFILQSEFADARFQAAAHLHSIAALTQIHLAMRKTDRRVSKFAQEKLADLQKQEEVAQASLAWLQQGQCLLESAQLTANHVTEWEKKRVALDTPALSTLKNALDARLLAQVALQQQARQLTIAFDLLTGDALALGELQSEFTRCSQLLQQLQSDAEVASLPKNQLDQLVHLCAQVALNVSQREQVEQQLTARADALEQWRMQMRCIEMEAAKRNAELQESLQESLPSTLDAVPDATVEQTTEQVRVPEQVVSVKLSPEQLRREWKNFVIARHFLGEAQRNVAQQQESDFAALVACLIPVGKVVTATATMNVPKLVKAVTSHSTAALTDSHQKIDPYVQQLEQALEQGSLQQALDADKSLRALVLPTRGELAARITLLRSELHRLLDWAKWGGNVSREELIKVADELPLAGLAPQELAKQVGGLRARWKELDRASGPAAKAAWERFDQACGRAYEIADEYFKQQARIRQENLQQAQVLLDELDRSVLQFHEATEFKALIAFVSKIKQDWRKIGPIDRKIKNRLEAEFTDKLTVLSLPLEQARERAVAARMQLIADVAAIVATDRSSAEKVQIAQQRWQQDAAGLPLERKVEQQLWQEFRAACDAVFAQRRVSGEQHKQRRHEQLLARQACCELLENDDSQTINTIEAALRQATQDWRDLNQQERHAELDQRFQLAFTALEQRLMTLVLAQQQKGMMSLRARIALCRQLEGCTSDQLLETGAAAQSEWDRLVAESAPFDLVLATMLERRFAAALTGVSASAPDAANLAVFQHHLLRLEILRGLESPPELGTQRMQLQVSQLKSALQHRSIDDADSQSDPYMSNLLMLCSLPVQLDVQTEQRFQKVLENYAVV